MQLGGGGFATPLVAGKGAAYGLALGILKGAGRRYLLGITPSSAGCGNIMPGAMGRYFTSEVGIAAAEGGGASSRAPCGARARAELSDGSMRRRSPSISSCIRNIRLKSISRSRS